MVSSTGLSQAFKDGLDNRRGLFLSRSKKELLRERVPLSQAFKDGLENRRGLFLSRS
jgi:hypothetical protein